MTDLQPKTVAPYGYDSPFSSVMFQQNPKAASDFGAPCYIYGPAYDKTAMGEYYHHVNKLSGLIDNAEDKWFVFYVADCFDPPLYAVSARNFQDAHEEFITRCEHLVKIGEYDLKDYNINGEAPDKLEPGYNDNGTPVETEQVMGFEVKLMEARR